MTSPTKIADDHTMTAIDEWVCRASNDQTKIQNYIQNTIIPAMRLPTSIYDKAAFNFLFSAIISYFGGISSSWQTTQFDRIIRDSTKAQPNYAIDAMFTWTVVNAVDYTTTTPAPAPTLFMRYVGVSYATTIP